MPITVRSKQTQTENNFVSCPLSKIRIVRNKRPSIKYFSSPYCLAHLHTFIPNSSISSPPEQFRGRWEKGFVLITPSLWCSYLLTCLPKAGWTMHRQQGKKSLPPWSSSFSSGFGLSSALSHSFCSSLISLHGIFIHS